MEHVADSKTMSKMKYLTLIFFSFILINIIGCKQNNQYSSIPYDSKYEYYISDSKFTEIGKTLSSYLYHSEMSDSEKRDFIYDLCDTIHPCLHSVFFRYTSKINGFDVEGTFGIAPDSTTDYYQSYGKFFADLYFSSDSFTFKLSHYTFNPFHEDFPDTLKSLDCIELTYKNPIFPTPMRISLDSIHDLPFAFIDIDFDGKKELLLANPGNGQKSISTYNAYSLPELRKVDPIKGYICNQLDEWTEFDYTTQTIISSLWGGYDGSEKWYFKYNGERLEPYLKEVYTHWFDSLKTSTPISEKIRGRKY